MTGRLILAAMLLAASLTACDDADEMAAPPPAEYTGEATGYFCGMLLVEHGGPKGQIHLRSREAPIWFSSVRDTVAFTLLEEEPKDIAAIYVNDMDKATDWAQPEPGSWVEARQAWFVVGSSQVGGMGLPEAVPFGTQQGAEAFAADNGGQVVPFAGIPQDYVLGMPDETMMEGDHATH